MILIDNLIREGWLKTPRIIEAFRKIKRKDFLPEDMKDLAELNEALPIGYGQTISQPLVVAFMLELLHPQEGEKILDIGSGSGWTSALLAHIVSGGELKLKIKNRVSIYGSEGEEENKVLFAHEKLKMNGKVIAIEIVPELKEFGEKNVAKYNFIKKGIVECLCVDGSKGYQKEAPFDKILASASVHPVRGQRDLAEVQRKQTSNGAREIPQEWKEQLKIGGRIVTPIGNSIWLFVKKTKEKGDEPSVHLHSPERSEGSRRDLSLRSAQKGFVFEEIEYPGFVFVPLITNNGFSRGVG